MRKHSPKDVAAICRDAERIASIIERVDQRAMAADGPVTPTAQEMRPDEWRSVYLACERIRRAVR